ncbi:MAG: phosphatase PAP2 family protein [Bacteroidetes bacterium]|nr:MAG: phosphatase PAP2 family protein [Bacteroidota bacterium]
MKAFLRHNSWFFIPYLVLLTYATIELILNDKGSFVVFLDQVHKPWLDHVFVQYTNLGDGLFALFICAMALFKSRKEFFTLAAALLSLGMLIQSLKTFFGEVPRPRNFFHGIYEFREIQWLDEHLVNSMPSGHTAAAFCLFALLAFFSRKKSFGYAAFAGAAFVGFSRMYLAQHFLSDVIAGSFIGTAVAVLFYWIYQRIPAGPHFNRPLIRLPFEKA